MRERGKEGAKKEKNSDKTDLTKEMKRRGKRLGFLRTHIVLKLRPANL